MKTSIRKVTLLLSMLLMLGIFQTLFAGDIINISTRANISGGKNDVFAGFVIDGTVTKRVIIRGISVGEGVDPNILVLNHFTKAVIGQNDDWQTNTNAHEFEALASNLQLGDSKDAGLLLNLNPGVYDVVLSSTGVAGLALVSVDDLQTGAAEKIINISTRANISGGSNDVFAGFVIDGATRKRVLVRGIGVDDGVDPSILVLDHFSKAEIGWNNNWQDNASAYEIEALASHLQLPQTIDAGLLLDLEPGVYDVVLSSEGSSGLALVSVDGLEKIDTPANSISILGISTDADSETRIGGALAPDKMATISITRPLDNNTKIIVDTESGEKTITPSSFSEDNQSISFVVPADIIDGNITIQGPDYSSTLPYTAFYTSTPYIKTLTPSIAQAGDTVEISGINLPADSIQLVFEGQDAALTVTASAGKIRFTVPDNVRSGNVYLEVAQLETNRLNLSVKRTINVQVRLGAGVDLNATDISFILGLKEHRLNINYTTVLAVEKNDLQYLHAMVDLPNDASSLLYSAVVLPDMSGTLTVDAKSTAVAWVFMGMGTSVVAERDQWRAIYDLASANAKVQAFADYIDTLQKNDFNAWNTRSDSQLKSKYQDALRDVMLSNSAARSVRIATQFETDTGVIIKQDPENNNIYIDQHKLDGGNVTIVNDTKLYLSVEVTSNEEENKGQIVRGYKHVENAILTNSGTLLGPKGWGLLSIASAQTLTLLGEDSHIEIITAARNGEPEESALSDSLRARVFIEGVALPTLNMVLTTIMDKRVANGYDPSSFVEAMQAIYGPADFLKQLTTQVSSPDTGFGFILDNLVVMPLTNGFNSCFQVPEGGACGKTLVGIAKFLGVTSAENIQKKIMLMIANSIEKRILKKSVALIPFAGWIAEAAFIIHDNIGYISDSATIAESLYDMKVNPKLINMDVEFPLQITSVLPLCVTYEPGDTTQTFMIQGDGFEPLNDIDPEVTVGVGSDETEATSLSISSTGTDMAAHFNFSELMDEGSWQDVLHVKNYGYWVTFPDEIRMVASTDDSVYFDNIAPLRAMTGDTITLNGCGWIPVDDIEVTFEGREGLIKATILDKTTEKITVTIPDEAVPGYVTVTTGNKKAHRFFHIKPFTLKEATVEKLTDKLDFDLQGYGLSELAHIYFVDHKDNRIEGIADNITDTSLSTGVPDGLAAGPVRIFVELKDGSISNELIMPKVPNKPTASPDSSSFEFSVTVTLSVEGEGGLYYRLDEYFSSPQFKYLGPTTLKIEDSEYANIYLYAFARVTVDGVNYDSEDAEYVYYPSVVIPPPPPTTACPVNYNPALDNDSYPDAIKLELRDKDGDDIFEDYTYCRYDLTGNLYQESPYLDSQLNGLSKGFYDSGQLRYETPYANNKVHGVSKAYYESGQIDSETPYIDGQSYGTAKEYYESGQLQKTTPYLNGYIHGIQKKYFESGQLAIETPYVDGKIHGIEKKYFESGQLGVETPYVDGKKQGTKNEYYPSGQLGEETPYVDDSEQGIARGYYESGKLKFETPYVNGNVHGLVKTYYESGAIWGEVPYIDDNEHGVIKIYYESGNLQSEVQAVNGLTQGLLKEYYESGQLKMEAPYVDGDQIGTIKAYYESGELQSELTLNGDILTAKSYAVDGSLISCVLYNDGIESGSCMP